MEKELPYNWVESSLKGITSFVIGGDWGKDPSKDLGDEFTEVLCIRGSEIKNWNDDKGNTASLRLIKKASLEKRNLIEGDILIEISGGGPDQPVGRIVFIDKESLDQDKLPKVCTNFLRMLRIYNILNKKYVSLFLEHIYLSGEVIKYQGGSNNLRNLKFKEYEQIKIPIPPLPEQTRIVAKLDLLFGQLEQIKESLDKIPQLLKDFRQQVLTQAVIGKLTAEWRGTEYHKVISAITFGEEFGERINDWEWVNLNEIAKLESGHTPRKSIEEYWLNGDIPWISLQDIRAANGKIIYKTKLMPTKLGIESSSARLLPAGTVCFSRDISVGFTTIMGIDMATTQHFANWICGKELDNKYLMFAFMASSNYLIHKGKGTTVKTLYYKDLKEFMIYKPPLNEQIEIVSRVESLFAKADTIEQNYQNLKQEIETLPQAILHKAFKGELVPQLESDGDARELLEEIKKLKKKSKS